MSQEVSGIDRVDLRELVDEPEVQGVAFLARVTRRPLLQLHEFDREVSVFWPSQPELLDPELFVTTFMDAFVESARFGDIGAGPYRPGWIWAEALMPGRTERSEPETTRGIPLEPHLSLGETPLLPFVSERWERSASFHLAIGPMDAVGQPDPDHVVPIDALRTEGGSDLTATLWTDRPSAELPSPETGFTSLYWWRPWPQWYPSVPELVRIIPHPRQQLGRRGFGDQAGHKGRGGEDLDRLWPRVPPMSRLPCETAPRRFPGGYRVRSWTEAGSGPECNVEPDGPLAVRQWVEVSCTRLEWGRGDTAAEPSSGVRGHARAKPGLDVGS